MQHEKRQPTTYSGYHTADEIKQLRLAEEGAKEAFGHVVQQKRDLEAECKRLRGLLDLAYDTIRRKSHNLRFEELKYRSRA